MDDLDNPLSSERIAIGQTADYRNAILSQPVEGKPGEYEFLFPKGQYIRDMVLRHSFDEMAYYQEAPNKPEIPGSMLVLGKAMKDISGIKIRLRKAGQVQLLIKTANGGEMPANTNINARYKNSYPNSSVRFGGGIVQMRSPKKVWSSTLKQIAPLEPLTITIRAPGYPEVQKTVELIDGETKTLNMTLPAKDDE